MEDYLADNNVSLVLEERSALRGTGGGASRSSPRDFAEQLARDLEPALSHSLLPDLKSAPKKSALQVCAEELDKLTFDEMVELSSHVAKTLTDKLRVPENTPATASLEPPAFLLAQSISEWKNKVLAGTEGA
jgi:hypothetical protein